MICSAHAGESSSKDQAANNDFTCNVTIPEAASNKSWGYFKNDYLAIALSKSGIYDNQPIATHPDLDGVKGIRQKFGWQQFVDGRLEVKVTKDGVEAPAANVIVPHGYPNRYKPVLIVFPEPGCWKINGSVNDKSLEAWVKVLEPESPQR